MILSRITTIQQAGLAKILYTHGKIIKGAYCSFCGARRTGTIIKERFRWLIRMRECGHLGFRGYTMPPEELERLGILEKTQSKGDIKPISEDQEMAVYENLERELHNARKRGEI